MKWLKCIVAIAVLLIVGVGVMQYHHHAHGGELCFCLDPTSHCGAHDADCHDDCDHEESDSCGARLVLFLATIEKDNHLVAIELPLFHICDSDCLCFKKAPQKWQTLLWVDSSPPVRKALFATARRRGPP